MELVFILVTLGGLLGFIVWDRRRMEHDNHRRPIATMSDALWSARMWCRTMLGLALVFVLLGVNELNNPSPPPFSGRGRFFKLLAYEIFGPSGPALLWFGFAVVLIVGARFVWRHTPKKPGERLFG